MGRLGQARGMEDAVQRMQEERAELKRNARELSLRFPFSPFAQVPQVTRCPNFVGGVPTEKVHDSVR